MTWLYVGLIGLVVVAACGVVPLRRYQDRRWAAHQRRQRTVTVVLSMDSTAFVESMQRAAEEFERMKDQIRVSMRPSIEQAAAAMAELAPRIEAIYRELPWWRRVWLRIRMRFTR